MVVEGGVGVFVRMGEEEGLGARWVGGWGRGGEGKEASKQYDH